MFLEENEYRKSTITSYNTYVSRFLRSSYYDEIKPDFKQQITEFLENEALKAPKTHKDCRAALHTYFKSITGTSYPSDKKEKSISTIEDLLEGFEQFQKSVKYLIDTTATSETNQVRAFLYYIYQQSPDNFNVFRNFFPWHAVSLNSSMERRCSHMNSTFQDLLQKFFLSE